MAKNASETGQRYKVGPGCPPREHRFSSTKQPKKNGRPKGPVSIKAELQKIMDITLKGEVNPLTAEADANMPLGSKIALKMAAKAAIDGDAWSAFRIMEQLDGKPAQDVREFLSAHILDMAEVSLIYSAVRYRTVRLRRGTRS